MTPRAETTAAPVAPAVTAPAETARGCGTWDELADVVAGCVACPDLVASRTRVVPGALPVAPERAPAEILFVGEAPGAQEDATGVPFVGRSGQLLDELLADAGLDRSRVAVSNVLKCRPPGNRTPRRAEVASCRPWLERQITLADPLLVVTLGGTAAAWVLGHGTRLGASRGVVHSYAGRPVLVTYHPSAAIRFGPRGAPRAALADDLAAAATLVRRLRAESGRGDR